MWFDVVIILYFFFQISVSQFVENQLCNSKCLCLNDDKIISCDKTSHLEGIPTNIDKSYHRLMIQNGKFRSPFIFRKNLTGLDHLTYLKVIYCNITGVESRAFEGMNQLKYLDLSHNNIRVIEPFTFVSLDLGELHLMDNHGMQILPDSFKSMFVESLNLRSNDLKTIEFETFDGIRLQKLFLYKNRISVVDPKFAKIFKDPDMLIDVTGNPLDCSCEMRWLLEFLKSKLKDKKYATVMKAVVFTCAMPLELAGKEMNNLSAKDLVCEGPKIKSITVNFGMPITQLLCVAIGNTNRSPGVSWNYIDADNVRELRKHPVTKLTKSHDKLEASLSVNVTTIAGQLKAFTCTTWLEDNQHEKIVVNIKSPPRSLYNVTRPSNKTVDQNSYVPLPESHFIFQKQFTILEMIGAIVGTFIVTLILLLMLAQILRWWKTSRKREMNYKTVNLIKPYWTLGHDSNTYSHPISTVEYDIPRVYDSRPSSICQSPPLSRVEFLDYKTLDKIYSP